MRNVNEAFAEVTGKEVTGKEVNKGAGYGQEVPCVSVFMDLRDT